jgi:hypothetical protein
MAVRSSGDLGVIVCVDEVVETLQDHSGALRITSRTGQRVTSPYPLGNGMPDKASRTELLPLL